LKIVLEKIEQTGIKHFQPLLMDLEKKGYYKKYDIIYSLMTMHHVRDVKKVIASLSKMLKKKGRLFIGDLEKEDGDFHQYPENLEVHFGFDNQKLVKLLWQNNLEITKYEVFHEIEKEHTGKLKSYPLFFLSAKLLYE